jgi:hypothetical protein
MTVWPLAVALSVTRLRETRPRLRQGKLHGVYMTRRSRGGGGRSGSAESWADLGQGAQAGHHQRKEGRKEKSRRVWRSEMCGGGLATGAVAAGWDWSGGCMMQDQEGQRLWFPVRAVGWWRAAIWRRAQVTGRNRLGRFWGDCGELCNEAYPGSRTCNLKEELL